MIWLSLIFKWFIYFKAVKKCQHQKISIFLLNWYFWVKKILLTFKIDFETDSVLPFPLLVLTFSDLFPGASLVFFKFLGHMSLSEIRQVHHFSVCLIHWHLWIFIQILKLLFSYTEFFHSFAVFLNIEVIQELKETCRNHFF